MGSKVKMAMKSKFVSPDKGFRLKNVTVIKPVVYGNVARYFEHKRKDHTREWTIYLKPFHNEDMSTYVKKVQFKFHNSYGNQNRILTKPPYEVTETGLGEFKIVIKLYFHDANEKPVTIYHTLKLFQSETSILMSEKSLVSESYDELEQFINGNSIFNSLNESYSVIFYVFQNPSASLHRMLVNTKSFYPEPYKHERDFEKRKLDDLLAIISAKGKIEAQIDELQELLLTAKINIIRHRNRSRKPIKKKLNTKRRH